MAEAESKPKLLLPFLQPFYNAVVPLSWPLIRVTVGGTLLVHGINRATIPLDHAAEEMAKNGLEPALLFAVLALVNETIGAVCVAIGLFTRLFAASIAIELAIISGMFFHNGYAWSKHGWEFVFLWGLIFLAIALRGGGPYSLDRKIGWEL